MTAEYIAYFFAEGNGQFCAGEGRPGCTGAPEGGYPLDFNGYRACTHVESEKNNVKFFLIYFEKEGIDDA